MQLRLAVITAVSQPTSTSADGLDVRIRVKPRLAR
jgi:hypothetical protein